MEQRVLSGLEPERVFHFFEALSAIPRGSGNTEAAARWCLEFARQRDLAGRQDGAGNVVLWKDATPGYEDHPPVILQGHLDMVCVKDAGVDHDFTKDGLDLYVDGDWVRARGTTLGGDNGVAVAMILAVLDDGTIPHPPIEAVFTADEEIGLLGAEALDCGDLKGRRLINLDSEDEGVLTVSCAGGARCDIFGSLPMEESAGTRCVLTVSGLQGGHSGIEIGAGRANASKLLARCLASLADAAPVRLMSVHGGLQDNAIPKEARAVFLAGPGSEAALQTAADCVLRAAAGEYAETDPGLSLRLETGDTVRAKAITADDTRRFIGLIQDYPNGVLAMSRDIPGLVQTSLNLGILRLEESGDYMLSSSIRSSVAAEKEAMSRDLKTLAARFGASFGQRGDYPAWEYRQDSPLRDAMVRIFTRQYGRAPVVEAIHAGLECGIFAGKLPGLDAVSLGPDMPEVHSTRERLSISSTRRTWEYLLAVLKEL